MRYGFDGYGWNYIDNGSGSDWKERIKDAEPLYTKLPKKKLSDEEIWELFQQTQHNALDFARAIEKKASEK
jgi:hypothetical protein